MKISNAIKNIVLLVLISLFFPHSSVFADATKTVGSTGADYSTLKLAFDAINTGAIKGNITLQIIASTTESAIASINASGSGGADYTAVNIYPTITGLSISANYNNPLIQFFGGDNIIIDGRVGGTGSTADLTIINTNTGSFSSAIKYVNSAENNIIKYSYLKSSCYSTGVGIINFTSSNVGNGNDNNIVEYCNITNAGGNRPINAIFTSGGSGRENSGNIIRNNNIYNILNPNGSSNGINISYLSTDWTISGNSFYETTPINPTGAHKYYPLMINTGTNTIRNNYIGGSEKLCGGTAMTISANTTHYFCGIFINGGTSSASIVENNTIANINYTSVEDNPWDGIFVNSGLVNVTGNTIGATTGINSIVITTPLPAATATITAGVVNNTINIIGGGSGYTTAPIISFSVAGSTIPATATAILTGGVVTSITVTDGGSGYTSAPNVYFDAQSNNYSTSHGILNASASIINITNNNIGSITTVGSNTYSHGFESMYMRGVNGTITISDNLVGSLSTSNSIETSSTAGSSLQKQDVYGIYSSNIGVTSITGNTVANLHNAYIGINSGTRARGIQTTAGSNIIQNNTVRNISTASGQSSGGSAASVIGISQTCPTEGTTQTITGNTIYDLYNTHATAKVYVCGLYYAGPPSGIHTVSANFIRSLSVLSSDISASIYGIGMNSGVATCANNIINIGSNSLGYLINGIWDGTSAGNNVNFYFNTVYLGGSVTSGVTSPTAALSNANNTSIRNYRNNILYNARTGGTTGKHYAIVLAGTATTTIDNNDYFFVGTMLGKIGTLEKANLTAWKAGTIQDVNSLSINPVFTIPGGTSALDYYTSASLLGVTGTGITVDYAGLGRSATPKMGALENNNYVWQGGTSNVYGLAANWVGNVVPHDGADISFANAPDNDCYLDINRRVGDVTNAQSSKKLVLNGYELTIDGDLVFSNGAQIDATSSSSKVIFAGNSTQSIPSGSFVSNTVDFLTINNNNGLSLNGNLTINSGIALTAGNFAIGPNTLTFNGVVTDMTGSVTGGSSTNMIIGGTGGIINMPAFTLNNLTINRASGVGLYGNLDLVGTLTLTNGVLNVGANILTIVKTPIRTSGSINSSNSAASVIFNNASAIALPASIFSADINNLSLTGAGGITSPSDITVNGVLNLTNVNPSATKGILDMWDGAEMKTLTMGPNATTVGAGDVTGIVTRTSFTINTPYSFGNEFTTINMEAGGTLPSTLSVKIVLTNTNQSWMSAAIHRYYDIIQTGGNSSTKVTTNLHYLDSELNGTTEGNLDLYDYHITASPPHLDDHGRSNDNVTSNWVGLGNMSLTYIAKGITFDVKYWTLGTSSAANFTWLGAAGSTWGNTANWVGGVVPGSGNHVVIPDATTTPSDPELAATATIGYLLIQPRGILNGGTGTTLTIDGGYFEGGGSTSWDNAGTFNPGTSTVVFTNAKATMADPTNFYNVTVADGAKLSLGTDNIMRIAGALSLSSTGVLNAANTNNTIEFNGTDQTIINPNGSTPGYYNLIVSGSGAKTLPPTALSVLGDFTTLGTATATAGSAMTIGGELTIAEGSTFATGAFNHTVSGPFDNSGTFTATAGYSITLNGSSAQSIYGTATTTFQKLIIDNSNDVTLLSNVNVNEGLTLTNGTLNIGTTTFGINGTISKTAGFLNASPLSSLVFGGTSAITLNNDLFTNPPIINNLTINRSGGVTLGNQNMTINGLLDLPSGTFRLGENTLTIAGSSPTRTTGNIDARNAGLILTFTNIDPIILPASIFLESVHNMTINGAGGITSKGDFTLTGILYLQSANPSDTKGSLDMRDGTEIKTLTMGADATTIGIGDVTGIVKRTTFVANTPYSFGNQFTNISFATGGTYPTEIKAKISIGTSPVWKADAVNRLYDFVQTGGSGCLATIATHYLDTELNGNVEKELVHWTYGTDGQLPSGLYEWGHSNSNQIDNWIEISNISIEHFPTSFGKLENTLAKSDVVSYIWNGSLSTNWATPDNWTPAGTPSGTSNVIIPDASTTLYSPILPASTELKSLNIETAGILNSVPTTQLTINGANNAWCSNGTFNYGTSNVIFTNAAATICGTTNFYDVTINSGRTLVMSGGTTMRIAGAMNNDGTWRTVVGGLTTVEYNGGDQTVVIPNSSTNRYSSLILSGSGVKTMPSTPLEIVGDFSMLGTAIATAAAVISLDGNVTLGTGTTFTAGSYTHNVGGNWTNDGGTFNNTGSTFNFNGLISQTIGGTVATTFDNLTLNNSLGIILNSQNTTVKGTLTFNSGKITTGANTFIIGSICNSGTITGAGADKYINGNMRRYLPDALDQSITFSIGDATNYAPVSVFFAGTTTGCGYLDASTEVLGSHPAMASGLSRTKYLNRKWTLTNGGVAGFSSYSPTFTFVPSDIIGITNTDNFVVKKLDTGIWSNTTDGIRTSTSTQCIGLTNFGDFYIGEESIKCIITNRNVHSK